MSFLVYAKDGQFGISSGPNLTHAPGLSRFDTRPGNSTRLIIAVRDGDEMAWHFGPGGIFELCWHVGRIQQAMVIRCDDCNGRCGTIVFEGTNHDGNATRVIWTPDFDLTGWYDDHGKSGQPRFFHTSSRPSQDCGFY
ncbi:hypothetical protein TG4357_02283 [Thalassovita gelatinovora]|uniref:Uncharacterized protein n=1 Tax=Thalassovita gelatinovora TaxID=53501 RepID=A0A0P1G1W4_THAGE|nr:hypothetical protein [Thalassovita gelatinovora]QIZ81400.1 hypothetical protein HFZ77_13395 [Thalassovita gelatinovora]CUH66174.1 hypothetical protein TG4357_02283 [Thalassovita gelatinovora]SEQ21145.1 hypothetical protein SAMN04488043_10412 [Thalassovita gelatinovora]